MEGGKIENRELNISHSKYRNTRRSKNRKAQHTKKNKMSSEMYHFKKRMNMPIGTSSFGIPLTSKMIEENERYYRDIEQRIKNGLH